MSEVVKISESLSDSSVLLTDVFMFLILIQVHWIVIFSFWGESWITKNCENYESGPAGRDALRVKRPPDPQATP